MTDIDTDNEATTRVVDAYLEGLHEQDPAKRTGLVEQAWVADGFYRDPLQEADGRDAIAGIAPVVEQHYPGHRFSRTSAIDAHHDYVRFGWQLAAPDGSVAVAGIDVGQLADDGRLQSIVGFFGDL